MDGAIAAAVAIITDGVEAAATTMAGGTAAISKPYNLSIAAFLSSSTGPDIGNLVCRHPSCAA